MNDIHLDRDKFFFAIDDADYYDSTIELTVPYYRVILDSLVDALKLHMGHFGDGERFVILDVGAGTGAEAIPLLTAFPSMSMIAVDISDRMSEKFQSNVLKVLGAENAHRWTYLVDDIFEISPSDDRVSEHLMKSSVGGCSAAISAYCIHHFSMQEKVSVYRKMFDFLQPGGFFANLDLFSFESSKISKDAHEFDLKYISRQFGEPDDQFAQARAIPTNIRSHLRKKWLHHMNHDNCLDSVDLQMQALRDIGFIDVECVFRYWQQGLIRGTKPS